MRKEWKKRGNISFSFYTWKISVKSWLINWVNESITVASHSVQRFIYLSSFTLRFCIAFLKACSFPRKVKPKTDANGNANANANALSNANSKAKINLKLIGVKNLWLSFLIKIGFWTLVLHRPVNYKILRILKMFLISLWLRYARSHLPSIL